MIRSNILGGSKGMAVKGTVVLMRKNTLDFTDFTASLLDGVQELLGQRVSLQLVSATVGDSSTCSQHAPRSTFMASAAS